MGVEIGRRRFLAKAAALVAGSDLLSAQSGAARALARTSRTGAAGHAPAASPRTLQQAMRGHVFERGAPGYAGAAQIYNERFDGVRPSAVARPLDPPDVRGAVRWLLAHDQPLRARSGGHSYAGYSTLGDGVVLDLRNLRGISVDHRARTATIGAGAQLIDVYAGLAKRGATIPAGSCPSVGIAGVTLGGGMGLAARALGLTTDNLLGAQIVTADGKLRQVGQHTDPDLLWALRGGGGGNFGVVTDFTFRVHPLPAQAAYFFVSWPWSSASEALAAWQAWAPHARPELTSILHLEAGGGSPAISVTGQYLGPASALGGLLGPMRGVPGAQVVTGDQGYLALQLRWAGCLHTGLAQCHTNGTAPGGTLGRASFRAKSDYIKRPLSSAGRATLVHATERRASQAGSGALLMDAYGGAINRVHPQATAFVHRDALFCLQYLTYGGGAAWLEQTHAAMRPHASGSAYQNYIDAELTNWQSAYYGGNYSRLRQIRKAIDPEHRFNFPQAIGR